MTISDILKACSSGKMPRVKTSRKVNGAISDIGIVVIIKCGTTASDYRGVGVHFSGLKYDTWFAELEEKDHRRHYMSELAIVSEDEN